MNVQNHIIISSCWSLISEVFDPYHWSPIVCFAFSAFFSNSVLFLFYWVLRCIFLHALYICQGLSSTWFSFFALFSLYFVSRTAFDCLILSAHSTWYSSRVLPAVTWFKDAFSSLVNCPSRLSSWLRFSDGYPSIMSKNAFHTQFRRHFTQ